MKILSPVQVHARFVRRHEHSQIVAGGRGHVRFHLDILGIAVRFEVGVVHTHTDALADQRFMERLRRCFTRVANLGFVGTVYASALLGRAGSDPDDLEEDMRLILDTIVEHVPAPQVDPEGAFQMQISALDYSSYVGVIGLGRIQRGVARPGMPVTVENREGARRNARILSVLGYAGLERKDVSEARAGDIVSITGIDELAISDTLCDPSAVEALPALTVDEPTVSMTFQVNTSPFAGRDGKFLTSRQIRARLDKELLYNVALRVEDTAHPDQFRVSGRGELHLSVLLETMRREGYELGVSRPEVHNIINLLSTFSEKQLQLYCSDNQHVKTITPN